MEKILMDPILLIIGIGICTVVAAMIERVFFEHRKVIGNLIVVDDPNGEGDPMVFLEFICNTDNLKDHDIVAVHVRRKK